MRPLYEWGDTLFANAIIDCDFVRTSSRPVRDVPASADGVDAEHLVFSTKETCREVQEGSWSCKNALAIASMPRDVGGVAVRGHFRRLVDFSVWKRF